MKLSELARSQEKLEHDANPFAIITAAHLRTQQTRNDPQERYQAKRMLVRLLYTHGWDRQRILDLFAVLDWMMRLPDGLEQKLWQDIEQIEGDWTLDKKIPQLLPELPNIFCNFSQKSRLSMVCCA